jgi:hypothetical protein
MESDFDAVPVEDDTLILFEQEASLSGRDVLYQKWIWDGIEGESIIFLSSDVSGLSDDELRAEVRSSPLVEKGSQLTVKRSETAYAFVNFNFS